MSTTTTNYNLVKPELTDPADITAMNQNWDTIDEELSNIGETVEEALGNLTPEAIGASPSDHTHTAEEVGALPLTGGTLTGDLLIEKSYPRVELKKPSTGRGVNLQATDSYVEFSNEVDGTNFRGIRIKPETEAVEDSVFIYQMLDGLFKKYNLYGEHNITKGTTDLEAGTSALKSGCIHLVYE